MESPSVYLKNGQLKENLHERLVRRCINGDRKAQYELYKLFVKPLYHAVIRLVPTPAEAEDILQDAFVSIFQNIRQYRLQSSLYTWMRRIVINKAIDAIRKKKKLVVVGLTDLDFLTEPNFDAASSEDLIIRLHHAIKDLPDGCREVLNLYLFEGFKHAEIATKLEISESTSKTQYMRAKKLLTFALSKNIIDE